MRRIVTTIALLAVCAAPAFAANQVRISQVYGGGGGSGTYLRDYVEIYNSGVTPVNIGGWTLEYGSATGNWASSAGNAFTFPVGTIIQPCQYLLLEAGANGTSGAALPVPPDFSTATTGFSMSATSGKVGLFNALNSNLPCGSELVGTLVDKVAYGTANCSEGTAVGLLSNSQSAFRNAAGATDTDNNLNDFTISGSPVPRNSSSFNPACLVTPTRSGTWGQVKSIYR